VSRAVPDSGSLLYREEIKSDNLLFASSYPLSFFWSIITSWTDSRGTHEVGRVLSFHFHPFLTLTLSQSITSLTLNSAIGFAHYWKNVTIYSSEVKDSTMKQYFLFQSIQKVNWLL
jgi:hypothetical protein